MGTGDEEVLDPVLFLGRGALEAPPAAALPLIGGDRDPLDVAGVGDGDDHVLFGDQILDREVVLIREDLGAAVVSEGLGDLLHLLLQDAHPARLGGQNSLQVLDGGLHLLELGLQLLDLEAGELRQPHVEDGLGLLLAQLEPLAEPGVGIGHVLRLLDDLDDFVDVVHRDLQAVEDVLPGLGRVEIELGAPNDHLVAVRDESLEQVLQRQDLRGSTDQGKHDHPEGGLHGGVLVELVQDHVGNAVPLELDHDPHAFPLR